MFDNVMNNYPILMLLEYLAMTGVSIQPAG